MKLARNLAIGLVALALGGAAVTATAATSQPVIGCKKKSGTHLAATSSYRFAFWLGMAEKMYTRAQAKAMHPKHGEVMLRGSMSMGGMVMSSMRHLEVQICSLKTSGVITNAHPTILVADGTAKGPAAKIPIAVMEGVGEGIADLHYGNNVTMPAGHKFTVTVTLKDQHVIFHGTSPKGR